MKLAEHQKQRVREFVKKINYKMADLDPAESYPFVRFPLSVYHAEDYRVAQVIARCLNGRITSEGGSWVLIDAKNPYYNVCNNLLNEIK